MSTELQECEQDVEQARAKLAQDLATLRSPATFSAFTDDLKQEAFATKDAIVEKARSTAEDVATRFTNEIKAKIAANPIAALAIGAGIGWRLVRNPPIATALIGAGLYGLWKTQVNADGATDAELVERGKRRLQEQFSAAASQARETASEIGEAAVAKATEATEATREKVSDWTDRGRAMVHDASDAIKQRAGQMADSAVEATNQTNDAAREKLDHGFQRAREFVDSGIEKTSQAIKDDGTRNQLLLSVAGLAVAAALGIACQRRALEDA